MPEFKPDAFTEVTDIHWKQPETDTEPTETEPATATEVPDFTFRAEETIFGTSPNRSEYRGFRRAEYHTSSPLGEIVEGDTVFDIGRELNVCEVWRIIESDPLGGSYPSTKFTISFVGNIVSLLAGKEIWLNDTLAMTVPPDTDPIIGPGDLVTFFGWRGAGSPFGETYIDIQRGEFDGETQGPIADFLYDLEPGALYTVTTREPGTGT